MAAGGSADVRPILAALSSPDDAARAAAEAQLLSLKTTNPPALMSMLATSMGDRSISDEARMQAALYWKNMIDPVNAQSMPGVASEDIRAERLEAAWKAIAGRETLRSQAVAAMLETADPEEQRTAALVVAKICRLELPDGWPEVFPGLMSVLTNASSTAATRRAALTCVAFIGEEVDESSIPPAVVNGFLTKAVEALAPSVTDRTLTLAGMECLRSLLSFCEPIFTDPARKPERDFLVRTFHDAAGHADVDVRVSALRGLANMVSWYYPAMPEYMPRCLEVTRRVIDSIADEMSRDGIQALEFWATLGEHEHGLAAEESSALLSKVTRTLAPALWTVLTTKRDGADETPTALQSDTTPAHVASEVLRQMILAATPAEALEVFLPVIRGSFGNPDWRVREGSISLLGFLCELGSSDPIARVAAEFFPVVMRRLMPPSPESESDPRIRPPLAWCAGLMLRYHFTAVAFHGDADLITHSIPVLSALLGESAVTARYGAFALANIAVSAASAPRPAFGGLPAGSPWIPAATAAPVLNALVRAMGRPDGAEAHLTVDAMDAFGDVLSALQPDSLPVVRDMLRGTGSAIPSVGAKLVATSASSPERHTLDHQLSLLCGTLSYLVRDFERLRAEAGPAAAAVVSEGQTFIGSAMDSLIAATALPGSDATIEAWRAVNAAVSAMGEHVTPKLPALGPRILAAMGDHTDKDTCMQGVHAAASLVTALGERAGTVVEPIFGAVQGICASDADVTVKAEAVGALGDMALSAGAGAFARFVGPTGTLLADASSPLLTGDEEDDEVTIVLRTRVLMAYSGIFTAFIGLDATATDMIRGLGQQAAELVKRLSEEFGTMKPASRAAVTPDYLCALCGTLSDVALVFTPAGIATVARIGEPWVTALCGEADRVCGLNCDIPNPGTFCAHVLRTGAAPP